MQAASRITGSLDGVDLTFSQLRVQTMYHSSVFPHIYGTKVRVKLQALLYDMLSPYSAIAGYVMLYDMLSPYSAIVVTSCFTTCFLPTLP